jgi:hypothetical protein
VQVDPGAEGCYIGGGGNYSRRTRSLLFAGEGRPLGVGTIGPPAGIGRWVHGRVGQQWAVPSSCMQRDAP